MHRGATAKIDLGAVAHNLGVVRKVCGNRPVIAVVKADAYGHGAREVSERLIREGASSLAVAFTEEGIGLRKAGIDVPILVLFDNRSPSDFFEYDLTPVIADFSTALQFSEEARTRDRLLGVQVKVDTGMGRVGLTGGQIADDIGRIAKLDRLRLTGVMSHFSDAGSEERSFAEAQLKQFLALREKLGCGREVLFHIANSAAVLAYPEAHLDAVRPGLMLYGQSPFTAHARETSHPPLRPAMSVMTRILSLRRLPKGSPVSYGRTFVTQRESVIAVISIGYADGYSRLFSNAAHVLIGGKRAPVVGRVCMDLTMVDVTGFEGVSEGDEVVLLGNQGNEEITAQELAAKAGTISYEILTSLGARSRRVYRS